MGLVGVVVVLAVDASRSVKYCAIRDWYVASYGCMPSPDVYPVGSQ
jgi:hypothetical protein